MQLGTLLHSLRQAARRLALLLSAAALSNPPADPRRLGTANTVGEIDETTTVAIIVLFIEKSNDTHFSSKNKTLKQIMDERAKANAANLQKKIDGLVDKLREKKPPLQEFTLTGARYVHLSISNFKRIVGAIPPRQLSELKIFLDLPAGALSELPALPELKTLSLTYSAKAAATPAELRNLAGKFPKLESLSLPRSGLSADALTALNTLTGLRHLSLERNRLYDNHENKKVQAALQAVVANNPKLAVLNLSGTNLDFDGLSAVAEGLKQGSSTAGFLICMGWNLLPQTVEAVEALEAILDGVPDRLVSLSTSTDEQTGFCFRASEDKNPRVWKALQCGPDPVLLMCPSK